MKVSERESGITCNERWEILIPRQLIVIQRVYKNVFLSAYVQQTWQGKLFIIRRNFSVWLVRISRRAKTYSLCKRTPQEHSEGIFTQVCYNSRHAARLHHSRCNMHVLFPKSTWHNMTQAQIKLNPFTKKYKYKYIHV